LTAHFLCQPLPQFWRYINQPFFPSHHAHPVHFQSLQISTG
jgi:hypothetical protein